ncbi:MAG: P22 phage major capsid protein family protein [Clostridia bacterium]
MSFLTAKQIARQALPILKENLVFPTLSHIEYSNDFGRFGDTIQVRKPAVYKASEFSGNIVKQDATETPVLVTLDKIADVSVEIGAKEMALSIEDFNMQVLMPAITAIAEKINQDGFELYKDIPYFCGESGVTPSDIDIFAQATKELNKNKAPISERSAIWDYEALAKLQTVPAVISAEKTGDTKALREGSIGKILGLNNYMSQAVKNHISGTASGISVKNDVISGNVLVLSGTGNLVYGDILVIGENSYCVLEDVELASAGVETMLTSDILEEISASTQVALVENHVANLAFNKNAFGFVTRPLEQAHGAESYVINFEGLTLRVTMDYDIATKKQILSVDTLYGFKTLYPELACRVLG